MNVEARVQRRPPADVVRLKIGAGVRRLARVITEADRSRLLVPARGLAATVDCRGY